uniref:C2H2-type domain-containing protein n=1 Tax=Anopheles culicifacies TaxID=139723 RepID=A0A182MIL8_9DIPT
MNSSAEKEICGICGIPGHIIHRNLMLVKTKFSSTTVFQLLERFTERELSHQITNLEASGACNDCLAKLNDYDAAYTKALILQQEFTDLLQNGTLRIFDEVQEPDERNEEEDTQDHKDVEIKWVPHLEHPDEMEQHEAKIPAFSIAGLSTVRVSMKCNVCGERFNNIHDMKLHSHEEASEEEQLETRARREPSPTLVIETVKSEPSSAANSDYDPDDYLDYTISVLNAKDEEDEVSGEYYTTEDKAESENYESTRQRRARIAIPFECCLCEAKFDCKLSLRAHFKTDHPNNAEGNICRVCGISTRTRAALASHYGKHLRETQLICEVCNKRFTQKASLQRHKAIHTKEKTYQCDMCGKQYLHYSSFYMHQLAHKNVRTKKCTICGYTLRSNSHLKRHMRTKETLTRNDDTKRKSPQGNMFVQSMFDMTLITINFCQICYILKVGPGLGWLYYFLLGLFGASLMLLLLHGFMGLCGRLRCSKPLSTSCFNCLYNASMFMVVIVYLVNLIGNVLMLKEAENKCQIMLEHSKSINSLVQDTSYLASMKC